MRAHATQHQTASVLVTGMLVVGGIDAAAVLCLATALIAVIRAARLRRPPVPG